jgi:4-amino-4-deoxy-L-arabinose transferase-like glycosyltransferase
VTTATVDSRSFGARAVDSVRSIPLPILLLAGLILARLAVAGWWLAVDGGVVDTESGRHLQMAWNAYWAIDSGQDSLFILFDRATEYPPLLHFLGVVGSIINGVSVDSMIAAQDLVCIPALAIGCYGAASVAYGRAAGVLAAVFALGAPMAVSVFHMFLIDTSEAAMTALAVWAILASDRFARTGVAALAGVAVGLGMLSKQNFPVFVAGLLLVVLVRGGWRHWRGLLVFAVIAVLISLTWYWSEVERTLDLVEGASTAPATPSDAAGAAQPSRWTAKNFAWYGWSTLNVAVLLPLTLFTVAGTVELLRRWIRTRDRGDYTPELVAGGVVAYLALTWISLKDPRYALPMLVYMAALGAGWIPGLRAPWRPVAATALCAIAAINLVGTVADSGAAIRVSLPKSTEGTIQRKLTFYSPGGWVRGEPETEGAVVDVMRRAKADGIEGIAFDPGANQSNFNHSGLDIASREAGLPLAIPFDETSKRNVMIANRAPPSEDPAPCAVTSDNMGVYLFTGPVQVPFEQRQFYCPPR